MLNISNTRLLGLVWASFLGLACSGGSTTVGVIKAGTAGGVGTTGGSSANGGGSVVDMGGSAPVGGASGAPVESGGSSGEATGGAPSTGTAGSGTAGSAGAATGGTGGTGGAGGGAGGATGPINVLVFNFTSGYGHQSRETAIPVLQAAAAADTAQPKINLDIKYALTAVLPEGTSDASQKLVPDYSAFVEGGLDKYDVVYFLNTTGNPLGGDGNAKVHEQALQDYMEKTHGGFAGTHSATDTFQANSGDAWPWYVNTLLGANFANHSGAGTNGSARYNDNTTHVILTTGMVPNPWSRAEEWYTFTRDVRQYKPADNSAVFTVLLLASDNQFPERPTAWVNQLPGGGRAFYTAFGHDVSAFKEPAFQKFFFAGLRWAAHRL